MPAKILISFILAYSSVALAQSRDCAVKCVKTIEGNPSQVVPIKGPNEFVDMVEPAVGDTPEERRTYIKNLCRTRYGGNAVYDEVATSTDSETKARLIVTSVSREFKGTECQPKNQEKFKTTPIRFVPDDDKVKAHD